MHQAQLLSDTEACEQMMKDELDKIIRNLLRLQRQARRTANKKHLRDHYARS